MSTKSRERRERIALGLGANQGSPERNLLVALRALREALGFPGDLRVASLYRSAPVSPIPQPDYLNTAVVGTLGSTSLSPEAVLALAKELERAAGRLPGPRFGPRPLDIDILVHGDRVSAAPELTLPHPRLRERRFVLAPLAEIAPELAIPPDGATVQELLDRLDAASAGGGEVERIGWLEPPL